MPISINAFIYADRQILVGFVIGNIRLKITQPILHMIASILTPFVAYFPAEALGGSGILATAVTGFMIGNIYALRYAPSFRIFSHSVWPMIAFAIQSILFIFIGLEMHFIISRISSIAPSYLAMLGASVIGTIIIGRFFWVYIVLRFLPRFLFPSLLKKDPYPPWQYPLIVSWSGMRGGISLAAALALPVLPMTIQGVNARDLIIFIAFCVIMGTLLIQGLSLPWLAKVIGLDKQAKLEQAKDNLDGLNALLQMATSTLNWLAIYKKQMQGNERILSEIKMYTEKYQLYQTQLQENIQNYDKTLTPIPQKHILSDCIVLEKILNLERAELLKIWSDGKITLEVRDRLLKQLDHDSAHIEV